MRFRSAFCIGHSVLQVEEAFFSNLLVGPSQNPFGVLHVPWCNT
jgi:hypothetical protein